MSVDFQDKIDDFVLGRMSENDRIQFLSELSHDKDKQEQLELTKSLHAAIKSRNEKLSSISQFYEEYSEEQNSDSKKKKVMFWMPWVASVAAVFLLGISIFISDDNRKSSSIVDTSNIALVDPIKPVDIIYSKGSDKLLDNIVLLLEKSEYEEALTLIMEAQNFLVMERNRLSAKIDVPDNINKNDFKVNDANVFSNNKDTIFDLKYSCKITNLKSLEEYEYMLSWMKANTLIGLNRIKEAKDILFDLRILDGTYKLKADSLYNEIEKRL